MKIISGGVAVTLLSFAIAAATPEHQQQGSVITSTPEWERVKSLVGEWGGYVMQGETKVPATVSVRITGDGSAVMHWMGAGTPHEMITMFHMDKDTLRATHYCAAHNQPRFRVVPGDDPSRIAFEFTDGTNIRPGDGYMRRLVLVFLDADHHNEEWSYEQGGALHIGTFYFARSK